MMASQQKMEGKKKQKWKLVYSLTFRVFALRFNFTQTTADELLNLIKFEPDQNKPLGRQNSGEMKSVLSSKTSFFFFLFLFLFKIENAFGYSFSHSWSFHPESETTIRISSHHFNSSFTFDSPFNKYFSLLLSLLMGLIVIKNLFLAFLTHY